MKKLVKWTLIIVLPLLALYFAGPQVTVDDLNKDLPEAPSDLNELQAFVDQKEAAFDNIKPDNEGEIVWFDSIPTVTEYSMVYLHGFSASRREGSPIHRELAKRYGCNLYLPRIAGHGLIEKEAMLDLTAEDMMKSAAEAIAVGMKIGKKVILVTTSTGGTYGLYLAGNNPDIAGLVLYSPNIQIYDPNSWLLAKPWGLQLARMVKGSDYHEWEISDDRAGYWTNKYRLEVLTELQALVETTMVPETFKEVTQPTFLGYYYKSEEEQDNTVSVAAMLKMYDDLGTEESLKRKVAFPESGHHVIGCDLTSGAVDQVKMETEKFLEEVMGLEPFKMDTVSLMLQDVNEGLIVE